MGNWSTLLTALLPLSGVIVGASLQYFFSKFGDKHRQLEMLRSQAYVDYLRSVAQIALVGQTDTRRHTELLAELTDAKTRICVYGSASVVEALALFEKGNRVLDSSDSVERFLVVCNEMRRQSLGESEVAPAESLSLILFQTKDR